MYNNNNTDMQKNATIPWYGHVDGAPPLNSIGPDFRRAAKERQIMFSKEGICLLKLVTCTDTGGASLINMKETN